ncbi:MAG TPA: efflux RND transporter periplasmic adaptor subunit [Pirellulales bacterium]
MRRNVAVASIVTFALAVVAYLAIVHGQATEAKRTGTNANAPLIGRPKVKVQRPTPGGLERVSTQPGSVQAFEAANLYAKVSGYLKEQSVDIGDRVKQGQLLAEIDVPELVKEVQRRAAELKDTEAQVAQMKSRVATAQAGTEVAQANIGQAEADLLRTQSAQAFAEKQYNRVKSLFALKSVDEELVDEKFDKLGAARSAEKTSEAAVLSAKAQLTSAQAKIDQAKADLDEAGAKVDVSRADLQRSQVLLDYTKIRSPYDGVVTLRKFHRGDFILAADQGGVEPLLRVAKTDVVRVVVQVPDDDVPATHPGEKAVVQIDALPGRTFTGRVSRMADTEDTATRTMRTEIDLPNPDGLLREGMYGRVTIVLHEKPPGAFTLPSPSIQDEQAGHAWVYVVRGGKLHRTPITIGEDNGALTEVTSGLSKDDQVVVSFNGPMGEGVAADVVQD